MIHRRFCICILTCLLGAGCLGSSMTQPAPKEEDSLLFSEAQKALEAHDYTDAIELFQLFCEQFPESEGYTWALQRLGESFEGLLARDYTQRVESGEPEAAVRREFLSRHGSYDCWEAHRGRLRYNNKHYRIILEKHPGSPIADEAAYRSIRLAEEGTASPEALLHELEQLEEVIERYPTTTLRYEILYKMAHRCHILYEIYSFSPQHSVRDSEAASRYYRRAQYLYTLALKSPRQTKYSHKAWGGLQALKDNKRIYILR